MSAGPYSIGSDHWPGISKLMEESGEVGQVVGKLLATNGLPHHWDGTNLTARLEDELGDLRAAIEFLLRHNPQLNRAAVTQRHRQKLRMFEQWHAQQRPKAVP